MRHQLDPIWRPAHEGIAVAGWSIVTVVMWGIGQFVAPMGGLPVMLAGAAGCFAVIRAAQVVWLWEKKARVVQLSEYVTTGDQVMAKVRKAQKLARKGKLRLDD